MQTLWILSHVGLWIVALLASFLLVGVLRALAIAQWRLEQLEAITPSRLNRSGLAPGKSAPAFALASTEDAEVALADFAGRRVLVTFVQSGCGPCSEIVPELNRLQRRGAVQVLAIINAAPHAAWEWAAHVRAEFPVLVQDQLAVSKRYEVFATPFAFLIDEEGVVAARGIITAPQHVRFLLDDASSQAAGRRHEAPQLAGSLAS